MDFLVVTDPRKESYSEKRLSPKMRMYSVSRARKRGAFLPQILNSANTHRDTIQVLQRQEQELRTRIAKHLSGQVRAPGASLIIGYGCKHGCRWRSVPARSGASQFALWASADDRYDTLSRVRTPGAPLPVKPLSHKYSTQKIFRIDDRHVGITEIL